MPDRQHATDRALDQTNENAFTVSDEALEKAAGGTTWSPVLTGVATIVSEKRSSLFAALARPRNKGTHQLAITNPPNTGAALARARAQVYRGGSCLQRQLSDAVSVCVQGLLTCVF